MKTDKKTEMATAVWRIAGESSSAALASRPHQEV